MVRLMQVLFFIMGIMVKLCDTDGVNTVHSLLDTQVEASTFCFTLVGVHTAEAVAWLILCAGLLVVLVPLGLLVQKLVFSQSLPILRDAQTMEPPVLLLRAGERYHLFLSHVWSTGQDQCAVVKRQLQLLLPGVAIFLDVDGAAHSIRSSPAFPPNPLILERCFIPCDPSCCRFAGYWRLGGLRARDGRDTLLPVEELLHLAQLCLASRGQGLDRGEAATGAGARAAGGQGRRAASNDADGDSAARRCASTSSMGARQSRGTASRTIPEPHAQIHCHRDAPARPQVYDDSLHSSSSQLLHSSSSQLANVIAAAHCHSSRNSSRRDELSSSERVSRRSSLVQWLAVQEAKPLAVQEEETSAAVKVQAVVRGTSTRQMSLGALVPGKVLSLVLPGEVNIAELALHNDLLCSGVALATLARRQWLTS